MKHKSQFRWAILLAVLLPLLGACRQPVLNDALTTLNFAISKENITFRVGTSFGECLGYCRTNMEVNGTELDYIEFAWDYARQQVPDRLFSDTLSVEEWSALVDAFDWQTFAALDSVIGCPDCADGGAEWIEVGYFGKTKKITIEYGADLKGLSLFLDQIRHFRRRLRDRIQNGSKFPQVVFSEQPADALQQSPLSVQAAAIDGDVLVAQIAHSGGCREHFYTLYMAPPAFMESYPLQANLYLTQYDNDDPCDAIIQQTRKFELRPIAESYYQSYGGFDHIKLNLHWLENNGELQSLQLDYHPQ